MRRRLAARHALTLLTLLAVLVAGAGAGAAAAAQARWTTPTQLRHGVHGVAGNAQGVQAFLWNILHDGEPSEGYPRGYVRAQLRLADGRLTRPQTLTPTTGSLVYADAIGLDARGTATALMTQVAAGSRRFVVSVRQPGGRFGAPVEIGRGQLSFDDEDLQLAVAPNGGAVVAWTHDHRIHAALRPPGRCPRGRPRACFGPVTDLGGRCPKGLRGCVDTYWGGRIALVFGARSRGYAAWTAVVRRGDAYATVIRLAVSTPSDRRFGRSRVITRSTDTSTQPALAVLRDGSVVAAWRAGVTVGSSRIKAATLAADGFLSAEQTISGPHCYGPKAAVDTADEVTLAWECRPGANRSIAAAVRPAGGPFGPATAVTPDTIDAIDPMLAVDRRGNTFLACSSDRVRALVRPLGGGFGIAAGVASGSLQRLVAAGDRVTLISVGRSDRSTTLRDWIG